jgi:hypothetical protein
MLRNMPASVYSNFCVSSTWQSTATFKLGSQVQTWQALQAEFVENIKCQKNLAENSQLGNLAQTWHKLVTNLAWSNVTNLVSHTPSMLFILVLTLV